MEIVIPINHKKLTPRDKELYYNDQKRYSSMTGVVFVGPNRLIATSYVMCEMYLIEFDISNNTWSLLYQLNTINTKTKKLTINTDLIDYSPETNTIIVSNFTDRSMTLYRYFPEIPKIVPIRTIKNYNEGPCHGICFSPNPQKIAFGTTSKGNLKAGTYVYDLVSEKILTYIQEFTTTTTTTNDVIPWMCKDIVFINEHTLASLYNNGAPHPFEKSVYDSKIVIYQYDNTIVKQSEILIPKCHSDCICYYNNQIYVTVQTHNDNGKILVFDITNNQQLTHSIEYSNLSFPHGLDIRSDLIAVTQYGNSSIRLLLRL